MGDQRAGSAAVVHSTRADRSLCHSLPVSDPVTAGPRRVEDRAGRYTVGRAVLMSLVAGRGTFRAVQLVTAVLLLPAWGAQAYGVYATAMASFSWLTSLVFTGPEKTVLKLLPRATRTGPLITEALLVVVWCLPVPLIAAFGWLAATGRGGAAAIHVGVATMLLCSGCTLLLIGMHRAVGRPRVDAAGFAVMSVTQLGLLLATLRADLGPLGYLGAVIATQVVLNAGLATALGRPSLRIRRRPGFLRRVAWTALLMGGPELALYLTTAVLFALLATSRWAWQAAGLYVAVTVWSVLFNTMVFVLRVYAPRTSLRLLGGASQDARRRAARLARFAVGVSLVWLAAAGLVAVFWSPPALWSVPAQVAAWGVLLAARAPALVALVRSGYLLENSDARAPRVTGSAAVAGLAAATVTGVVAVPAAGALGVLIASAVADLAQATVIAARASERG